MSHFFTLLCKLIAVNINRKIVLPVEKLSASYSADDAADGNSYPATRPGSANDDLALPATVKNPKRQRWLSFNIFRSLQINLAPVAVERPVFAYTTQTCTTTQTNRMKQILRQSGMFAIILLIANLFFIKNVSGKSNTGLKIPTTNAGVVSVTTPQNGYASDNQYAVFDASGDAVRYGGFSLTTADGGPIPRMH